MYVSMIVVCGVLGFLFAVYLLVIVVGWCCVMCVVRSCSLSGV